MAQTKGPFLFTKPSIKSLHRHWSGMMGVRWLILVLAAQACKASENSCTSGVELPQDVSDCSAFLQSSMHRSDPETTAPKEQVAKKIGSRSQEKASFPGMWRRPLFER